MNIKKHYLTNNECFLTGTIMDVKGLMLHSVGCNVQEPMNFITSWDKKGVYKCVHAFIGKDIIYETLPYNYKGWHCGKGIKGSFNNNYIGVEMCEPKSITYVSSGKFIDNDYNYTKEFVLSTYNNAVDYFAYLCQHLNLNPLSKNMIISHSEGYKLGYASNHGDVEHLWSYIGLDMNKFRKDVYNTMNKIEYKSKEDLIYKDIIKNKENKIVLKNMMINKKLQNISTINISGYNYVKLDDLKKLGMNINYDTSSKLVSIDF